MNQVNKCRKIAIACFIISSAAALAAAPLLLLTMNDAGSIPAAIALYVTSLIFYGYGTAITIYAVDLAAPLKHQHADPAINSPQTSEKPGDPAG